MEMLGQRRQIGGVMIHVVAVPGLAGAAMAAAVMGDDAKTFAQEEQQLRIPVVRRQRPAMAEHDRLSGAPVLVKDLGAICGCDRLHEGSSPVLISVIPGRASSARTRNPERSALFWLP